MPKSNFEQSYYHRGGLRMENCLILLTRDLTTEDLELSTGRWLNNFDILKIIERQNWDVLGFCRWTGYGCIRQELQVDFSGFAKDGIKVESPCEQKPWK